MYSRPRLIPCLSIKNRDLVKTTKFSNPRYLGDPINAVRIFNGKGVDELCITDINATLEKREPDFDYLQSISSEAFMPLSYGGGIKNIAQIERLFYIGYEKVIINTSFILNPGLIAEAAKISGNQSIVVSIDVKTGLFAKRTCFTNGGETDIKEDPVALAQKAEKLGAGEILLNSINRDGTMQGYDIDLTRDVSEAVSIPVIACGGAKDIYDIKRVLEEGKAHAAAAGSMYVYYGSLKAVLINAPDEKDLFDIGVYKL